MIEPFASPISRIWIVVSYHVTAGSPGAPSAGTLRSDRRVRIHRSECNPGSLQVDFSPRTHSFVVDPGWVPHNTVKRAPWTSSIHKRVPWPDLPARGLLHLDGRRT